jgi:outer membrane protein OmpA-like peptidoglycan-associated protein
MQKLITVFLLLVIAASLSFSQKKSEPIRIGVQFNPLIANNEFPFERRIRTSWLARALVRFGVDDYLSGEVGIGYGRYAGNDIGFDFYKTTFYPADFRLNLKLVNADSYPYFFLGVGGMYYEVENFPLLSPSPKEVQDNGFAGFAPIGLGYNIELGQSAAMDINLGLTITTTDNLNYFKEGDAPDAYFFAGIGFLFGGGPTDDDNDGLLSDREEEIGTDPLNPDTDNDGLKDGEEIVQYSTDPLNRDTDGDGLTDGDEVKKYRTNPLKADTDGDGLNDREEVIDYKTDPMKQDTDGDTLSDSDEVRKYRTDPLSVDTDKDGLNDGDEINKYKTNPLKADTDGDGLNDNQEITTYKTNPLNKDTDGGTVEDGVEVNRGTDPLQADDDVVKIGQVIVLEGITFETNSAEITPESAQILQKTLETLRNNPEIIVEISGHTDDVGSDASNKKLSQARAFSVKQWLVNNGIEDSRLNASGYGEERPIAPNDSPENRRKNRRIEFIRIK